MNNLEYARALREAADRIENLDCALDAQRRLWRKLQNTFFHLHETVLKYDTMLGEADTRQRKAETDFKYGITQGEAAASE